MGGVFFSKPARIISTRTIGVGPSRPSSPTPSEEQETWFDAIDQLPGFPTPNFDAAVPSESSIGYETLSESAEIPFDLSSSLDSNQDPFDLSVGTAAVPSEPVFIAKCEIPTLNIPNSLALGTFERGIPLYMLCVSTKSVCFFVPGTSKVIEFPREDIPLADLKEKSIYRASVIVKNYIRGFKALTDRTLSKYINRNAFICKSVPDYREVILQGLLLGSRARDYEQRCAVVKEIGELVMTMSPQGRWLDGLELRTKAGESFFVTVKGVERTEKMWTVTCFETLSPLPDGVEEGSHLEILREDSGKRWQTAVTGALFHFHTKKSTTGRPIENWPLLECIYGEASHLSLPRVPIGDPSSQLKNGEYMQLNAGQAEALARYNSASVPGFVIGAPPGSGKTTTAAAMAASYKGKGMQLILSTANVPVNNTALALAKFDLGNRSPIHLTSAEYEHKITEETRSPFTSLALAKNREELRMKIEELEEQLEKATVEEDIEKLKKEIFYACEAVQNEPHDIYIATLDTILKRVTKPNQEIHEDEVKNRLKTQVERIIVEEASQFTEAALNALILTFPKAQIVLIGDSRQLPPFRYNESEVVSQLASRSALEVIKEKKNIPVIKLTAVYRTSSQLCAPYSDVFYDGALDSHKKMDVENPLAGLEKRIGRGGDRCIFWKVNKGKCLLEGFSKVNEREISALSYIVKNITKYGCKIDKKDIMIICYYEAQRKKALADKNLKGFEILTVDSAQGREKRIVIVLTTRSGLPKDPDGSFFCSPKRCNVAISRHQDALIVLGHPSIASAPNWAPVLAHKSFTHFEDDSG